MTTDLDEVLGLIDKRNKINDNLLLLVEKRNTINILIEAKLLDVKLNSKVPEEEAIHQKVCNAPVIKRQKEKKEVIIEEDLEAGIDSIYDTQGKCKFCKEPVNWDQRKKNAAGEPCGLPIHIITGMQYCNKLPKQGGK